MLTDLFAKAERVLAAITALLLFTLNELRMVHSLPRSPVPAEGQTLAAWINAGGGGQVYLSGFDVAVRWGLVGFTVLLCAWALAETLKRRVTA